VGTNIPTSKLDVAGAINTSSEYRIVGQTVLSSPGYLNTFVGFGAGVSTTGYGNAFFGEQAGLNNTSGSFNTYLGGAAGKNNTTGVSNVFLGNAAGLSNTAGTGNMFLGANSGGDPGVNNSTVIGYNARGAGRKMKAQG
jgi:hypothetical protein